MAFSDADRPTLFTKKVDEEGLTGRELATARLINKLSLVKRVQLLVVVYHW